MIATVVGAYALGTILGLISVRISRFRAIWSRIIRTQILAVASIASVTSVWAMNSWNDILWPALLTVAMAVILVLGIAVTKPPLRGGRGGLLDFYSEQIREDVIREERAREARERAK